MHKRSDTDLITAIQAGGQQRAAAWKYMYNSWRGYYLKPVLNKGGTPDEVYDIMGKVFQDVDKQLSKPDFELKGATLATYFSTAVYRSWAKKKQYEQSKPAFIPEEYAASISSSENPERHLIVKEVLKKVKEMREPCRTILIKKGEGFSNEEISEVLNFSVQHVKNMGVECKKELINLIGGEKYY